MAPVRIWTNNELLALLRPSCLCRVLSLNRVSCRWSKSSAGLVAARPSRSSNHLSLQASSTTLSVSAVPPVHPATVIAASSTAVGPCGPRARGRPLLFLLGLNLRYNLSQAAWTMLPAAFLPPWPSSRVGIRSRASKSASRLLKYRSNGGTHVSVSRLRKRGA